MLGVRGCQRGLSQWSDYILPMDAFSFVAIAKEILEYNARSPRTWSELQHVNREDCGRCCTCSDEKHHLRGIWLTTDLLNPVIEAASSDSTGIWRDMHEQRESFSSDHLIMSLWAKAPVQNEVFDRAFHEALRFRWRDQRTLATYHWRHNVWEIR